ncbi:hypothetical protein D3C80_2219270 [compost metagenome]
MQAKQKAVHVREELVHSEKWLKMTKLYYKDELGVERVSISSQLILFLLLFD